MLAVCQVFQLLKGKDRMFTGFYMVENMSDAALIMLAKYNEGFSLLKAIKSRFNEYQAFWAEDKAGFVVEGNRISPIISEKRSAGGGTQLKKLTNFDPRSYRKLFDFEMPPNGKKDVCWELPTEGDGFTTYNRNDEDADGLDQIGKYQTIQAIITIARTMRAKGAPILEIGDISRAGGLDTSAHDTHEDGKAFDIRPLRNDGQLTKKAFTWNEKAKEGETPPYHRGWTIELTRTVLRLYPGSIIYFNDPLIFDADEFRGRIIKYGEGTKDSHDNHLHIILPGGQRGDKEGN